MLEKWKQYMREFLQDNYEGTDVYFEYRAAIGASAVLDEALAVAATDCGSVHETKSRLAWSTSSVWEKIWPLVWVTMPRSTPGGTLGAPM